MKTIIQSIIDEVACVIANVNEEEALTISCHLQEARRVFVYGDGRSGLVGKAFAMRLMHGGLQVYVAGETITPSIEKDDLLIVISGSGLSETMYRSAYNSKEIGAKVLLVTSNYRSDIAKLSDGILYIPTATKYRLAGEPDTIQPLFPSPSALISYV